MSQPIVIRLASSIPRIKIWMESSSIEHCSSRPSREIYMETAHTQSPPWKVLGFRETRVVPFSSNLRGAGRQTLVSTSVNTFYQSKQRSAQSHQLQSISSPKLSKAVSSPQFLFPTALTWDLKSVPPSRPKIKRNEQGSLH